MKERDRNENQGKKGKKVRKKGIKKNRFRTKKNLRKKERRK